MTDLHEPVVYLERISREMTEIRKMLSTAIHHSNEAESEIPEKMRRFVMYMHDIHDIVNLYHEGGQEAPQYVKREMERCDDRFRQLLDVMHLDGGAFEKIRREMADDPLNRWDHTRLLTKITVEKVNETRTSKPLERGVDKG